MAEKARLLSTLGDDAKAVENAGAISYHSSPASNRRNLRSPFRIASAVMLAVLCLATIQRTFFSGVVVSGTSRGGGGCGGRHRACIHTPDGGGEMAARFGDITPSEKLIWHSCHDEFQCARLTVPMDYNRPLNESADHPKVHIALIMVPGRNHTSSEKYSKSPLVMNPGGPGGSGVDFLIQNGYDLRTIVGQEHDIISFDPRGIGETTPLIDCYSFPPDTAENQPSDLDISRGIFHRITWALTGHDIGFVNSSSDALSKLDTRARVNAKLCKTKDEKYGKDSIFKFVTTTAVARDMLSIVDAWDAWREESKSSTSAVVSSSDPIDMPMFDADDSREHDTKGKLVYWGVSYGTLLGATFAALFPDRVGRLVLDGVVDADLYGGPLWSDSLRSADAVEASFFSHCHLAGPRCAFYRPNDTISSIQARFLQTISQLKSHPVVGIDPRTLTPSIITYEVVKFQAFRALYSPIDKFPDLAQLLDLFYRGDEEEILGVVVTPYGLEYKPFCERFIPPQYQGDDASLAIMCGDKVEPLDEDLPALKARFEDMAETSSYADFWMTSLMRCNTWNINITAPPLPFSPQPPTSQRPRCHPSAQPTPKIKTANPLLFISNTLDPVTPLFAGLKMANKFESAGFLEQLAPGHSSLTSASLCTTMTIRAYLATAVVPKWRWAGEYIGDGTQGVWRRCGVVEGPWGNAGTDSVREEGEGEVEPLMMAEERARVLAALEKVRRGFSEVEFWGGG